MGSRRWWPPVVLDGSTAGRIFAADLLQMQQTETIYSRYDCTCHLRLVK
jgi:hypothetical protein